MEPNRIAHVRRMASRLHRRIGPGGALAVVVLAVLQFCPAASAGVIEYTSGISSTDAPTDLVQGSDGNVWFTEPGTGRVGRITPTGTVTQFSAGITAGRQPYRVAKGADGNVWFTERGASDAYVGRITPAGVVSEFVLGMGQAGDIAAGPDGNVWARVGPSTVYRVTTTGVATPFPAGVDSIEQDGIVTGPDGNLWLTGASDLSAMAGVVGRLTPTGTAAQFHTGIDPGSSRATIAVGSDGNLWFSGYGVVYRITPAGVVAKFVVSENFPDYMRDMALGSDNALWATREDFSTTTGGSVFRIATDGTVAEISCGITPGAVLNGITAGPGGDLWIAAEVGRIIRMPTNPDSCPPINTAVPQLTGSPYPDRTLSCSTGSWTGSPTSYDYQWQYDGFVLPGQTASTLLVLDDERYIGRDLSCRVTARAAGGATSAVSAPLHGAYDPLVPVNQTLPQATGTGKVGDTLSCSSGTWTNAPTSYSYQWYDQAATPAAPIAGATGTIYTIDATLNGHKVLCRVKAANASGTSRAASSAFIDVFIPDPVVTTPPPPPVAPPPPPAPIGTSPAPLPPTLTVRSRIARSSLAKGIRVSVSHVPAGAKVALRVLLGPRTLSTATTRTTTAGTVRLTAKLSKAQRAKIRKGSKLKLRVTVTPKTGTAITLTRTVRVG